MSEEFLSLDESIQPVQVLLVEDEEDLAVIFSARLQHDSLSRFEVSVAGTLQAALDHLKEGKTDIILLDLNLPDSKGFDTFLKIQPQAGSVPIVIMSGNLDEDLAIQAIRKGAQDYVMKVEFDSKMLPRLIRHSLERVALEKKLQNVEKMEAIGTLAGGLAHDLNNLLLVIRGGADLLAKKIPAEGSLGSYVAGIKEAGDSAASLTMKLLDFARGQMTISKTIEINDLILRLEKMIRSVLRGGIELVILPSAKDSHLRADPVQIERCIMNLVLNSAYAMPEKGSLVIETKNVPAVDGSPGDFVLVSVRDSGHGMTEEVKKRAFEPFFTTKEKGSGTGLGLASVFGIIKQTGAHMVLESAVGKGTTVKMYFPVVRAEVTAVACTRPVTSLKGSETILVAEDFSSVRRFITNILQENGYRVIHAADGFQALETFKKLPAKKKVDLVLTDMVMPKMNGKELAQKIRKLKPKMKVLFMSAYTKENLLKNMGLDEKKTRFIPKPFLPDELLLMLREFLDN